MTPRVPLPAPTLPRERRPRSLALGLVEAFEARICDGQLVPGDKLPTESAIVAEFGVSRTVVREAISKLQAAGRVRTRHGIGSFVAEVQSEGAAFRLSAEHYATLRDVLAVLELRLGVETEAAGLAALRRRPEDLSVLRTALDAMDTALALGEDAAVADFEFHLGIARATQNPHFMGLLTTLGPQVIPRARLGPGSAPRDYLHQVQAEHEAIFAAIAARDADASRRAMRMHLTHSQARRRQAAGL